MWSCRATFFGGLGVCRLPGNSAVVERVCAYTRLTTISKQAEKGHRWFAAGYDALERLGGPRMRELRRAVAGEARGAVLEIGCGTGGNLPFYEWSGVTTLDATEPDPHMLKRAETKRRTLPAEVQGRVRLHPAPAERLPFPDGEFDTAVSTLALCTVNDPAAAIGELRRVLKAGGRLLLLEHVAGHGALRAFQGALQPLWGWTAAGCHLTRGNEEALSAGGFTVQIEERIKLAPFIPAWRASAKPARISGPLPYDQL